MIIFLLIVILLAILFPGSVRFLLGSIALIFVLAFVMALGTSDNKPVLENITTKNDSSQTVDSKKDFATSFETAPEGSDRYWSSNLRVGDSSSAKPRERAPGANTPSPGVAPVAQSPDYGENSRTGRCLLRVEGRTYLDAKCRIVINPDGGFSIGTADRAADLTYFASVNRQEDGRMLGYWNGQRGATHAQTPLGSLRRNGGCWENAIASVCAWR